MEIDKLIKMATLEKNGAAKEAYRAIKAELLLNNSSKNPKPEGKTFEYPIFRYQMVDGTYFDIKINELDLSIIKKQIQIREEQIAMYDANSRKDLADMYREQMKYLKELLPPEISKEKIQEFITTAYPNGYPQKEMKQVINKVISTYPTADKKTVAMLVKEHIV
jgi:uncharacterized protein YqeY